jgi:hypoxanthine-guanine phosphoribosyltransferase
MEKILIDRVIGFGLDDNGLKRNLQNICVI